MADSSIVDDASLNRERKPFFLVVRTYLFDWYVQMRSSMTLTGWVILGLGLITLLAGVLAGFPGWFGPIFFGLETAANVIDNQGGTVKKTDFVISISGAGSPLSTLAPVIVAILLYIAITLVQPRLFPWPQRRIPYFLTLSLTILLAGIFIVPILLPGMTGPFQYCLVLYAIIAHARVALGKKHSWLVEGIVLAIVLFLLIIIPPQPPHMVSMPANLDKAVVYKKIEYHANQLLLRVPLIGVQITWTLQWFEAFIWATGLLCLHIYTGIGVHEREARQRSERLIKELTLAQEQLRAYALHAEELATMRERTRVAREVHDTLAQGLAAIKMHLETSSRVFPETPGLAHKHVERARELAGEYLQETRNSILNLRTSILQGRTLPAALDELVATSAPPRPADGTRGSTIRVICTDGCEKEAAFWQTLAPAVELACYRMVQEAVNNAVRHGEANHIDVELSIEKNMLCLTITDDGRGFEPATLTSNHKAGGFGIIGMHERLKQLNGRLEIISAPGAGTQVVAMIPLSSAQSSWVAATGKQRSNVR